MASSAAIPVTVLVIVSTLSACSCECVYYVKPSQFTTCPADPCFTLEDYISGSEVFISDTVFCFLPGFHYIKVKNRPFHWFIVIRNVVNITFVGVNATGELLNTENPAILSAIACGGGSVSANAGIAFINVTNLSLVGLQFQSCGAVIPQSVLLEIYSIQTKPTHSIGALKTALFLANVQSFSMMNTVVVASYGYGIFGVNVVGSLNSVSFNRNNYHAYYHEPRCYCTNPLELHCRGGNALFLFQDPANESQCDGEIYRLEIKNASFYHGVNLCNYDDHPSYIHSGGGFGVILSQSCYRTEVILDTVHAEGNSGESGGNMYFFISEIVDNSSVRIQHSYIGHGNVIFANHIYGKGAGIMLMYGEVPLRIERSSITQLNNFTVMNCTISHNIAAQGAGMYFKITAYEYMRQNSYITVENSSISDNTGLTGLGALIRVHHRSPRATAPWVMFQTCSLSRNKFKQKLENSQQLYFSSPIVGTLWVVSMNQLNVINCTFYRNTITALAAKESNIIFHGNNSFISNIGLTGGAIGLVSSKIFSQAPSKLVFYGNLAMQKGGAIYVEAPPLEPFGMVSCFFQLYDANILTRCDSDVELLFSNNSAVISGNSIYGGMTTDCYQKTISCYQGHSGKTIIRRLFHFDHTGNSEISSDPFDICLCDNSHLHCDRHIHQIKAYPGEVFTIPLVAVGQEMGIVPATVFSQIYSHNLKGHLGKGQHSQLTGKACTEVEYSVFSNASYEYIKVTVGKGQFYGYYKLLNVSLLSCPCGFALTPSGKCDCDPMLKMYGIHTCNVNQRTIYRNMNIWMNCTGNNSLVIHNYCPLDYCSMEAVNVSLDNPDDQCSVNHSGTLCGGCKANFSRILGGSQCLKCSNAYIALVIPLTFAGITLVVFLFVLNLTTGVGTINGLVFYANIVAVSKTVIFPMKSMNVLTVFIAWVNLDLGIESCFFDGLDTYVKTWLQLAFPVYVWGIVGLTIIACKLSMKVAGALTSNAIPVLATLFLLSYSKILRTIITMVSFCTIRYPDGPVTVWMYDGNEPYLKGKHIVLFLAGIFILLFISIPYTLLFLFGQFLLAKSRWKILRWVNRLMPLLDAHQAPYKARHRYWTGLMLLVRVIIIVALSINSQGNPNKYLLVLTVVILVLLLILTLTGGVYRSWGLNVLEASFIFNLGILFAATFYIRLVGDDSHLIDADLSSTNSTSRVIYSIQGPAEGKQKAVFYVSVSVALATFVGIIVYHLAVLVKKTKIWTTRIHPQFLHTMHMVVSQFKLEHPQEQHILMEERQHFTTVNYAEAREPLIESNAL